MNNLTISNSNITIALEGETDDLVGAAVQLLQSIKSTELEPVAATGGVLTEQAIKNLQELLRQKTLENEQIREAEKTAKRVADWWQAIAESRGNQPVTTTGWPKTPQPLRPWPIRPVTYLKDTLFNVPVQ